MKLTHILAATAVVLASTASAQPTIDPAAHPAATTPNAASPTTNGEVRKIDKAQGKMTLKHGPIATLDMPGMTMIFRVADPRMLDGLREGDAVTFTADRIDGAITVTAIQVKP